MGTSQVHLSIPADIDRALLCGPQDSLLRAIEQLYNVQVFLHDDQIIVSGCADVMGAACSLVSDLISRVSAGEQPSVEELKASYKFSQVSDYTQKQLREDVVLTYRGRALRPKTVGQKRYCDAIRANTVTFGVGPAGTGKTYLAMAMAVSALKRKEIGRIILTRPVVEAGESLGFLPGTLTEKVDPYVKPLYDALFDMTDMEKANMMIQQGIIEIAPLAFMRGRTFNDAFLVLDEAQNTTPEQMKMFLTRLGFGSKMVITGDLTQGDLPGGVSGLREVSDILCDIEGIAFCNFTKADVVRHNLVAAIVEAYEAFTSRK